MPIQSCPACRKDTPRLLDDCSKLAYVNYYRCENCGHTWNTDKNTGVIVNHVTTLTKIPNRHYA